VTGEKSSNHIYSAYEGWKRNGQKNPNGDEYSQSLDQFMKEDLESTEDLGLVDPSNWTKLPGMVRIPVCSLEDLIPNLSWWGNQEGVQDQKQPPCPEYPCCSKEVLLNNLPSRPKGLN
jgi:hypothetical protein